MRSAEAAGEHSSAITIYLHTSIVYWCVRVCAASRPVGRCASPAGLPPAAPAAPALIGGSGCCSPRGSSRPGGRETGETEGRERRGERVGSSERQASMVLHCFFAAASICCCCLVAALAAVAVAAVVGCWLLLMLLSFAAAAAAVAGDFNNHMMLESLATLLKAGLPQPHNRRMSWFSGAQHRLLRAQLGSFRVVNIRMDVCALCC